MYIYGFIEKERVTARREEEREGVRGDQVSWAKSNSIFFFFFCVFNFPLE